MKYGVMVLSGHFGETARGGQWAQDPVGESQDQRNKRHVGWQTMYASSMPFVITKSGSSLPWWELCSGPLLRPFEEIPVAHTGFPIHIPQSFLKGAQSPSSQFQRKSACPLPQPKLFGPETSWGLYSWWSTTQTQQHNGATPDLFFLQRPNVSSTMTMFSYSTHVAGEVNTITVFTGRPLDMFSLRSSWVRAQLQCPGWRVEAGQLAAALIVGVKLPVTCVSLVS